MAAGSGPRPKDVGAGMAEEIIAGEDVVDLEAVTAREALADVALQQCVVPEILLSLSVAKDVFACRAATGLTVERRRHL